MTVEKVRTLYLGYWSETCRLGNFVWCIAYKVENMYLALLDLGPIFIVGIAMC